MLLLPGGMDVFYIDESNDKDFFVVTAIAVPFMRQIDGAWQFVWQSQLRNAQAWRKAVADTHKIPISKELHAWKLVSGRGNYLYGKRQLRKEDAAETYTGILSTAEFLGPECVITVSGTRGKKMYGHDRLERVLYALFQRMRRQCIGRNVNAMVYFDQGHDEYRKLYRRARVNLPTGSLYGGTRNLPLDMFVEDGNEKNSKFCHFTQIADLISYAALAKIRDEHGALDPIQAQNGLGKIYQSLPNLVKNLKAGGKDGIIRLG